MTALYLPKDVALFSDRWNNFYILFYLPHRGALQHNYNTGQMKRFMPLQHNVRLSITYFLLFAKDAVLAGRQAV